MTDLLLHPALRRLVQSLGLPIPVPVRLRRDGGPWQERSLSGRITVIGSGPSAECLGAIAAGLDPAGAVPYLAVPAPLHGAYRAPPPPRAPDARRSLDVEGGVREPRPSKARDVPALAALGEVARIDALVFDATGLAGAASLRALPDFFQPLLRRLEPCARAVVVARPAAAGDAPDAAAAQAALLGFVKSLAKELGRTGTTVNLVRVTRGAEDRLGPVLRFVLSGRAAFVTGQPLCVTAEARAVAAVPLMRPLAGKVALVTGAARGIGEATARLLALEGAHVVCLDLPEPRGEPRVGALAREIGGTPVVTDVASPDAPALVAAALEARGGVDVIVHNAGITRDKTLARMPPEAWDTVLDVNLGAALRLTAALDGLLHDEGRVVCLSSVSGLAGNFGQTAYAASKAGLAGFARALAEPLAPRGITVNAVAPGFIETRLTAAMPTALRELARRLSALAQGGVPDDVAHAIVFLASPGAHGITGSTLRVCGGAFVGA